MSVKEFLKEEGVEPSEIVSATYQADYETGERCGAGGFQIISLSVVDEDGREFDITNFVDQGAHLYEEDDVKDILRELGFGNVDVEQV